MKNLKKGILAIAMIAIFTTTLSATTKPSTNGNKALTTISHAQKISKLEVKGNVNVFITQGTTNSVKVYDNYYSENAYIQNDNSTLRITSYGDVKLSVWVTVTELNEIEVSDYAQVFSTNTINTLDLRVSLNNHATAKLDLDAYQLNTKIAGNANLELSGKTELLQNNVSNNANVDLRKFSSNKQDILIFDNGGVTFGSAFNNQSKEVLF